MLKLAIIRSELWTGKQFFWGLVLFMLVIALFGTETAQSVLIFDYDAVVQKQECWRLFSSQFVHWNLAHSLSNLAVFSGVIWLINSEEIKRCILLLLLLTLVMGLSLLVVFQSALYAGFSANLYGLVVFVVLTTPFVTARMRWIVVAIICAKLLLEYFHFISTESMSAWIDASVATDMHLLAVIFSLLFYLVTSRLMVSRKA